MFSVTCSSRRLNGIFNPVSRIWQCAYPALWYLSDDWPGSATPVMRPEIDSSHTYRQPRTDNGDGPISKEGLRAVFHH